MTNDATARKEEGGRGSRWNRSVLNRHTLVPSCRATYPPQSRSRKAGVVIDAEKPVVVPAAAKTSGDADAAAAPAAPVDAPTKMFGDAGKLSRARQVDQLLMGTFEGGKGEAAPEELNKHLYVGAVGPLGGRRCTLCWVLSLDQRGADSVGPARCLRLAWSYRVLHCLIHTLMCESLCRGGGRGQRGVH